jgi:hypothetical protein
VVLIGIRLLTDGRHDEAQKTISRAVALKAFCQESALAERELKLLESGVGADAIDPHARIHEQGQRVLYATLASYPGL